MRAGIAQCYTPLRPPILVFDKLHRLRADCTYVVFLVDKTNSMVATPKMCDNYGCSSPSYSPLRWVQSPAVLHSFLELQNCFVHTKLTVVRRSSRIVSLLQAHEKDTTAISRYTTLESLIISSDSLRLHKLRTTN